MTRIIVSISTIFLLTGCLFEDWTGVYYPLKFDRENYIVVGQFGSLDSCRDGMKDYEAEHRNIGAKNPPEHECRLNCTFDDNNVLQTCEETHINPRNF